VKTHKSQTIKSWSPPKIGDRPFVSQRSYRWRVEALKWLLPAAALGLAIAIGWSWLNRSNTGFRLDYALDGFELSGQDEMINPRFIGVDRRNQRYTVTAEAAMRPLDGSEQIFLIKPAADISMSGGDWLIVNADQGTYNRLSKILSLMGTVQVYADNGFEMNTDSALFDAEEGVVTSDSKTRSQGPWGVLDSEGFRYSRNEDVLYFYGRPKLTLYPKPTDTN